MFDTTRIAAQALRRAEETSKTKSLAPKIAIVTSMFAIVICLVITLFLSNTMAPADDFANINPMPVPLAAPHDNPITDGAYKCPICETEVENPN